MHTALHDACMHTGGRYLYRESVSVTPFLHFICIFAMDWFYSSTILLGIRESQMGTKQRLLLSREMLLGVDGESSSPDIFFQY